jgi:hypothetical protein
MFTLWFDRASEVLLARFTGVFTTEDFTNYDAAMVHFLGIQGPRSTDRWRTLCDLSAVEAIAVPESRLAEQGSHPPIVRQMRVVVAPPFVGDDFGNGYREQQRTVHGTEPIIVANLKEAYVLLGLDNPQFEAVEQS